jgi:hypothetical protein
MQLFGALHFDMLAHAAFGMNGSVLAARLGSLDQGSFKVHSSAIHSINRPCRFVFSSVVHFAESLTFYCHS